MLRRLLLTLVALLPATPSLAQDLPIRVDGDPSDWPADTHLLGDDRFVWYRFVPTADALRSAEGGENQPLVPLLGPTALRTAALFDLDGDATTGRSVPSLAGVDLMIEFNPVWPKPAEGERWQVGPRVTGFAEDGAALPLSQWDIGLVLLPTTAAEVFELRFTRLAQSDTPLPPQMRTGGEAKAITTLSHGREVENADATASPGQGQLPPAADVRTVGLPVENNATLPEKPENAVRVMSYNVERAAPLGEPEPFTRIITALSPDVILLQEWGPGGRWQPADPAEIEGWFTQHVGEGWKVYPSRGAGVSVVTKLPAEPGPQTIARQDVESEPGEEPNAVRGVLAKVETQLGPIVVGTVHLKCCGYMGSEEDEKRLAELTVLQAAAEQFAEQHDAPLVIAGDFNDVGSPALIDSLKPARPIDVGVLGDSAIYTWRSPIENFPRGRLDRVVASEGLEAASAFLLDTTLLSAEELQKHSLQETDTNVSDHLPLVVDLVRVP